MMMLHCINRNIVECKVNLLTTVVKTFSVLIETLWNVKYKRLRAIMVVTTY